MKKFLSVLFLLSALPSALLSALHVAAVYPKGEVDDLPAVISVSFEEKAADKSAILSQHSNTLFHITPHIPGELRYKSEKSLEYICRGSIEANRRYRVRLLRGYESPNGEKLRSDFGFSFVYNRLSVDISAYPPTYPLAQSSSFLLKFSLPVDIYELKSFVRLENKGSSRFRLSYNDGKSNEIILRPYFRLYSGSSVKVSVLPGDYALVGDESIAEEVSASYQTAGDFFIKEKEITLSPCNAEDIIIEFSNPVLPKDFYDSIRLNSRRRSENEPYGIDRDLSRLFTGEKTARRKFFLPVRELKLFPSTEYEIYFHNLNDIYGNKMSSADSYINVTAETFPPAVKHFSGVYIIPAGLSRSLPLIARGTNGISLRYHRASTDELLKLGKLNQYSYYGSFQFRNSYLDKLSFATEEIPLSVGKYSRSVSGDIAAFSVNRLLEKKVGYARFAERYAAMIIRGEDFGCGKNQDSSALAQFSDIGLSVRYSLQSNFFYAYSLKDGKPIHAAQIFLFDRSGKELARGKSSESGMLSLPGTSRLDFSRKSGENPEPFYIVVRKDKDRQLLSTAFERKDIIHNSYKPDFAEYIIKEEYIFKLRGDKNICRPGGEINFFAVLREKDESGLKTLSNEKVRIKILNKKYKEITNAVLQPIEHAGYSFTFYPPDDIENGVYYALAAQHSSEGERADFSEMISFRIEDYTPMNIRLNSKASKEILKSDDGLSIGIDAQYISGSPLSYKKVLLRSSAKALNFRPPGAHNERFTFGTLFRGVNQEKFNKEYEQILDENGMAAITLENVWKTISNSIALSLSTLIETEEGEETLERRSFLIHPSDKFIGLTRDKFFPEAGKEMKFAVVLSDKGGEWLSSEDVMVRVFRLSGSGANHKEMIFSSNISSGINEGLSRDKELFLRYLTYKNKDMKSETEPVILSCVPETAGEYLITAVSGGYFEEQIRSEMSFYAVGGTQIGDMEEDIELITEKDVYRPGEKVKLLIRSPSPDMRALITVEGDRVYESRSSNLKSTLSIANIEMKEEYAPNVYIGVQLFPKAEEKIFGGGSYTNVILPVSLQYKNIKVDSGRNKHDIVVRLSSEEPLPGEPVDVHVNVLDSASRPVRDAVLIASVVDENVLRSGDHSSKGLYESFYSPRPLKSYPMDSRAYILSLFSTQDKYSLLSKTSEAEGAERDVMEMDEFYRSSFSSSSFESLPDEDIKSSTVYYNPNLKTDAYGSADFQFNIDKPGSYRVVLHSVKDASFGFTNRVVGMKKSLVNYVFAPESVLSGDSFKLSCVVHNYSQQEEDVKLMLSAEGADLNSPAVNRFSVPPSQNVKKEAMLKAAGKDISINSYLSSDEGLDSTKRIIKVREEGLLNYSAKAFVMKEAGLRAEVPAAPSGKSGAELRILAAADAAGSTGMLVKSIEGKAYTENLEILISLGLIYLQDGTRKEEINNIISAVNKYQSPNGYLSYTAGFSADISVYLSAYVLDFLVEAEKAGYDVPETLIKNVIVRINRFISGDMSYLPYKPGPELNRELMPYLVYVMSKAGYSKRAEFMQLLKEYKKSSVFGLSYLLKSAVLLNQNENIQLAILNELDSKHSSQGDGFDGSYSHSYIHSSRARDNAAALSAILESRVKLPYESSIARLLAKEALAGYSRTGPHAAAAVHRALNEYSTLREGGSGGYIEVEGLPDGSKRGTSLLRRGLSVVETKLSPKQGFKLKFETDAKLPVYIAAGYVYEGGDELDPSLKVKRRVYDPAGNIVEGNFIEGSEYTVALKIECARDEQFVLVEDMVAGGFEMINKHVKHKEEDSMNLYIFGGFSSFKYKDKKYAAYASRLTAGEHEVRYKIKAKYPGDYLQPAACVHSIYSPLRRSSSSRTRVKIAGR